MEQTHLVLDQQVAGSVSHDLISEKSLFFLFIMSVNKQKKQFFSNCIVFRFLTNLILVSIIVCLNTVNYQITVQAVNS